MKTLADRIRFATLISTLSICGLSSCNDARNDSRPDADTNPTASAGNERARTPGSHENIALVITRGLPEFGTKHGIDLIYIDPESANFGTFVQRFTDLPYEGGEPPHHLYYSPTGRLYATGLDPRCSLMQVDLQLVSGTPVIEDVRCIPTNGHVAGEDILWRTVRGKELMYVTFMGGKGEDDMMNQGSVLAFDATTNEIVAEIVDPDDPDDPDDTFVKYPHGITAYGDTMIVSSTVVPSIDIAKPEIAIGNTISVIDMVRNEVTETRVIDVSPKPAEDLPSSPVEVLLLRPQIHPRLTPGVLVNTMFGGDMWYAPYDPRKDEPLGEFSRIYTGASEGTGVPLEFYGFEDKFYVSHAHPGVIKQYDLASLPALVPAGPDFHADAGAHHLVFFTTRSGRRVMASQNNLLDLRETLGMPLSAHTLTIHDLETAEKIATIDFRGKYQLGVANVVGALDANGTIGEEWFTHHH